MSHSPITHADDLMLKRVAPSDMKLLKMSLEKVNCVTSCRFLENDFFGNESTAHLVTSMSSTEPSAMCFIPIESELGITPIVACSYEFWVEFLASSVQYTYIL